MDVTCVLKQMKKGKSKDPFDIPNELFMLDAAGDDLILAITKLMNRIQTEQIFPSLMGTCNVTNLYKNKGSKQSFDSYRGIFRTPVLRNIFDKLIYDDEYNTIDESLTNCNVGSRRGRNIWDNLFVINAIMNKTKQNPKESLDIGVYDVHKCFDSLWLQECINDLYESGLTNDKLNLIYMANEHANIAIKTSSGTTNQFSISKVVMQGTVWAGLMCSSTMDRLCQKIYKEGNLMYKYRGRVCVPPLEMVDDIVTAINCGEQSVNLNAKVNTFVEQKKLKLSAKKCSNIHIGNKETKNNCPTKTNSGEIMKESDKEKYLGDFLTSKANSKDTIESRKARGYSILSEISAMLKDLPMGNQRTQIGLELRKAWFHNSCLANSEVWNGISDNDLNDLAVIDNKILRVITGAQSKVPVEMLFLETGQISIYHVISVRRLMYWHTILKRNSEELIYHIYRAMKETPLKGDWIKLLEEDLEKVGLSLQDEIRVSNLSKTTFKSEIKKKIIELSNFEFECLKISHEKVRLIVHKQLNNPQTYLTSGNFSNSQRSILFNLRSSCENNFRDNFHNLYQNVLCQLCNLEPDTQKHAQVCHVIK